MPQISLVGALLASQLSSSRQNRSKSKSDSSKCWRLVKSLLATANLSGQFALTSATQDLANLLIPGQMPVKSVCLMQSFLGQKHNAT